MLRSNIAVWRCIPTHFEEAEIRQRGYHRKNIMRQLERLDIIRKIHIDVSLFLFEGASIKYGQYMNSWTEAEGEFWGDEFERV